MAKSLQKTVWLFCVLLLVTQSLLPVSAIALVTVRCVGMPAASPACAQTVMPIGDTPLAATHLSAMPCCRHMSSKSVLMCCRPASLPLRSAFLGSRACLVTINPLGVDRTVSLTTLRQWMLNAAPALAPPTAALASPILDASCASPSHRPFDLLQNSFTHSHGLRAPPTA